MLSSVRLFVNPWTVAPQDPLSMGVLQTRMLKWVTMPSSRGSSQPRDWTQVSNIAGGFFTDRTTKKALIKYDSQIIHPLTSVWTEDMKILAPKTFRVKKEQFKAQYLWDLRHGPKLQLPGDASTNSWSASTSLELLKRHFNSPTLLRGRLDAQAAVWRPALPSSTPTGSSGRVCIQIIL